MFCTLAINPPTNIAGSIRMCLGSKGSGRMHVSNTMIGTLVTNFCVNTISGKQIKQAFAEFDGLSSDSDLPPTVILESSL